MKNLKLSVIVLFTFFIIPMNAQERQVLIGKNTAVFYPDNFIPKATLPSFALQKEPQETGEVSKEWKDKVVFSKLMGRNLASVKIDEKTDLYGTGEVTGKLVRNGTTIKLWNTDNVVYANFHGRRLYQSHPWVLGVREDGNCFGVLADNTYKMELSLGEYIEFSTEGPAFRVIYLERETPQEVMKALAELTGYMPMPPLWSLGFQQSRWSYYPDSRVREIADTFRLKKLPCDVIWIDIHYMDDYKVFTFDPERFPNPEKLNNYLHDMGYKAVWMIDPGIKVENGYDVYDSGQENNVWVKKPDGSNFIGKVWPGDCVFPDFTQSTTRKWWAGLYEDFMDKEIDGVWNDMNEPSVFDSPEKTIPEEAVHRGDSIYPKDTHARYHNVYGMMMIKSSREGIMKAVPDKRPFILTRSNFLGGHRYGATWTGDNAATWEHLKLSIPMSLNLGLSGQSFSGPDIGGFGGNASPELFGHWMGLGTFYPFARAHTMKGSKNQEPWCFGEEVEEVSRMALERRYRLMPYLYTNFYNASNTGEPVMQPAFFADHINPRLREEQEAFLFGSDLYIVPNWAEEPRLPKGNWRLVTLLENQKDVHEYLPEVRIRPGAIVPLGKVIQNTTEYSIDKLTLLVNLNEKGEARGGLYHDDGDGYGYKHNNYALVTFKADLKDDKVELTSTKDGDFELPNVQLTVQLYTNEGIVIAEGELGGKLIIDLKK
ncbi:MAG: TIM-barrel domain-containing protein [Bacteroidota bacterium]